MQAQKSEAENKAAEMTQQLQELKAQRAAAHSRNLALEKLLELQGLQPSDNGKGIASDASNTAPASNSRQINPAANSISTPIQLMVNVDALARACAHAHQAPVVRFTTAQLEELEFADFAKLWKEYISRCAAELLACMMEPFQFSTGHQKDMTAGHQINRIIYLAAASNLLPCLTTYHFPS